jgi:hypothetical protein
MGTPVFRNLVEVNVFFGFIGCPPIDIRWVVIFLNCSGCWFELAFGRIVRHSGCECLGNCSFYSSWDCHVLHANANALANLGFMGVGLNLPLAALCVTADVSAWAIVRFIRPGIAMCCMRMRMLWRTLWFELAFGRIVRHSGCECLGNCLFYGSWDHLV